MRNLTSMETIFAKFGEIGFMLFSHLILIPTAAQVFIKPLNALHLHFPPISAILAIESFFGAAFVTDPHGAVFLRLIPSAMSKVIVSKLPPVRRWKCNSN